MEDFVNFCKEYGLNKNNSNSLSIFNNFTKFMANMKAQRERIQNETILDCYRA